MKDCPEDDVARFRPDEDLEGVRLRRRRRNTASRRAAPFSPWPPRVRWWGAEPLVPLWSLGGCPGVDEVTDDCEGAGEGPAPHDEAEEGVEADPADNPRLRPGPQTEERIQDWME
jgi:hypothetical protein